jgi:V8-like Glu-specific endopeptidase
MSGGVVVAVAASALLAPAAAAQVEAPPASRLAYHYDSGRAANRGTSPEVVISFPVVVQEAPWVRLSFSEVELSGELFAGTGSILRITSVLDGEVQEMNELHVSQWQQTTAYFNGDMVLVEVVAHPGTGSNRVVLEAITVGELPTEDSICGPTDDRVLSSDPRMGRLMAGNCTAFLIDDCNTCALTAGHCSANTFQANVLQFNVPLSTAQGGLVNPSPDDQYAVDPASIQSNGGQGPGDDWGYLGCFPNSNTGLTPFEAQGARFAIAAAPPFNPGDSIRVTGYGVDTTPPEHNQVQQTHAGPWTSSGASAVSYQVDTEGGNSGSPVIHEPSGTVIGIHTHPGCTSTSGSNAGTAITHAALQVALANPTGVCAGSIHVAGELPAVIVPGVETTVTVQVAGPIVPGSVTLHERYDGGSFVAQPMVDVGGGLYQGRLLAGSCADAPEFFFSVQNTTCGQQTAPGNAPASSYAALVGTATEVFHDDFETDMGWTAEVLGATSGDWQRGVPVDDPSWFYDPATDGDGSGQAFLTQNELGNTDVDNGAVRLTSPAVDMTAPGILLRYFYFLNLCCEGEADGLLLEASDTGPGGSFVEVARHETSGALTWRTHLLTAADFTAAGVALTDDMALRFTANDADPQSINEAGLDGVEVSSLVCGAVGESYCTSNGATISAGGSASIAANDLVLQAGGIAPNKVGIFIYSQTSQAVPFGGGTKCVGPSKILRIQGLLNSGAGGVLTKNVDYTTLAPSGQIGAGETWHFQAWFRSGGSFDLSDGVRISFTP